jgi:hypothetical protein
VEASCTPNGVGIVKVSELPKYRAIDTTQGGYTRTKYLSVAPTHGQLMGRDAGFIAAHATLSSADCDLCLIPETRLIEVTPPLPSNCKTSSSAGMREVAAQHRV